MKQKIIRIKEGKPRTGTLPSLKSDGYYYGKRVGEFCVNTEVEFHDSRVVRDVYTDDAQEVTEVIVTDKLVTVLSRDLVGPESYATKITLEEHNKLLKKFKGNWPVQKSELVNEKVQG